METPNTLNLVIPVASVVALLGLFAVLAKMETRSAVVPPLLEISIAVTFAPKESGAPHVPPAALRDASRAEPELLRFV